MIKCTTCGKILDMTTSENWVNEKPNGWKCPEHQNKNHENYLLVKEFDKILNPQKYDNVN